MPAERVGRWFENFTGRHGETRYTLARGGLLAQAADGATAEAWLPWGRAYDGGADPSPLAEAAVEPVRWGLLLVRRGGFAVAGGTTRVPTHTKVGRRHVQGRTKAGGWSQQRFARRRDNQAREAFAAAADHAHRILLVELGGVEALVCGGDRAAVEDVLADRRLDGLAPLRTDRWLAVPDPSRQVLDGAVRDAWSVAVTVREVE